MCFHSGQIEREREREMERESEKEDAGKFNDHFIIEFGKKSKSFQ